MQVAAPVRFTSGVSSHTRCPMKHADRIKRASRALGVLLGGAIGVSAAHAAPPGSAMPAAMPAPMTPAATAPTVRVNLADVVQPEFRDAVMKVVKNPTIS